jgi:hypothetical protein
MIPNGTAKIATSETTVTNAGSTERKRLSPNQIATAIPAIMQSA